MKILDKPIQVKTFPITSRDIKHNKSLVFKYENITLLTDNPFKTYRLLRIEDIDSRHEVYAERARLDSHCRYQVKKLERENGLEVKFKVVSRWFVDTGFVEVYVINETMKPGVGYTTGVGTVDV